MTIEQAKLIFDQDDETKGYIPDPENDIVFEIDGYCFVIQAKNGFNNVIFAKFHDSKMTLRQVFFEFVKIIKEKNIQFLRIEGKGNRYGFLPKMFPKSSFLFETENGRTTFYIKSME
jgi:hypothetical protein